MAAQAGQATYLLGDAWRSALQRAAWLHDVGYGDELVDTGMHALDGARWLARRGWPTEVCRIVAWHTTAEQEAELLGLSDHLAEEFARPDPLAAAVMTWADLTSSPNGDEWASERRLADILERHPADSIMHRATVMALPDLRATVREIESRLLDDRA